MPDETDRPKLPVLEILHRSFIFTFQSYVIFLKWLLFAIIFVKSVEISTLFILSEYKYLRDVVCFSIYYLAFWPIPVIIHRNIILDETVFPRYISVFFKYYYWQYVLAALLISFFILAGTIIPFYSIKYMDMARHGHTVLATFTLILMAMVLIGRFSLILPMKAVGHDGWVIRSWRISKGNTLRLAVSLFIVNVFAYIIERIVRKIFEYIGRDDREFLSMIFDTVENFVANTLIDVLGLSLNACALAYAYRVLTETKPSEQE